MLTLPLDWLASLSVSHFHVGCQMRKQLKRVISALFSCQSYYKIQHWHWLHNVRSSRDQGSMCVCVCVCQWLLVCVRLFTHYYSYLFVFQRGIQRTMGRQHKPQECVYVCVRGRWRKDEGWGGCYYLPLSSCNHFLPSLPSPLLNSPTG